MRVTFPPLLAEDRVPHCCLSLQVEWQCRVPSLLGGPGRSVGKCPTGHSVVLLQDFNDNDSDTWRGGIRRDSLPNVNPRGELLLDACASHNLSIMNTMFKHKGGYQ